MTEIELITDQVFNIKNEFEFEALALKVFDFQFKNNKIYR